MFLLKGALAFSRSALTHRFAPMMSLMIILLAVQAFALHLDQPLSRKFASLQRRPQSMRAMISMIGQPSIQNNPSNTRIRSKHTYDGSLIAVRSGLTFDPCMSSSDCRDDRECSKYDAGKDMYVPCTAQNAAVGCTCDGEKECKKRSDCPQGEICTGLDIFGMGTFLSTSCSSEASAIDRPELVPLQNGLTMDSCNQDSDCHGNRSCFVDRLGGRLSVCTKKHRKCVCLEQPPNYCSSLGTGDGCDLGERCGAIASEVFPICVSEQAIKDREDVYTIGGGLGLQPCAHRTDCAGDRDCILVVGEQTDYCVGREDCFCGYAVDPDCNKKGNSSRKCHSGEICVEIDKGNVTRCAAGCRVLEDPGLIPVDVNAEIPCAAPSPTPSEENSSPQEATPKPSTEDEGVCIDVRALQQFDTSELVFKEHKWAKVLCDSDESCATAGHMVQFKGRAMMMMTYCTIIECTEREMYVNSPRYRNKLEIATNTEGLQFTAFAARYATRTEEVFLSAVIRVGL